MVMVMVGRLTLAFLLSATIGFGAARSSEQKQDVTGASTVQVRWQSGTVGLPRKQPQHLAATMKQLADAGDARHVVVAFENPVTPERRVGLSQQGLVLLDYLGNGVFSASFAPKEHDTAFLAMVPSLVAFEPVQRRWKLHPAWMDATVPPWAIIAGDSPTRVVAAYVVFHRDVPLAADALRVAEAFGARVRSRLRSVNALVVEVQQDRILALADRDEVQWIEPPLPPLEAVNDNTRRITQADIAQQPPYGLDGTGVNVLVFDAGGALETHPDFGRRLRIRDEAEASNHATHVACTVGGNGALSAGRFRGMAPNVRIQSYALDCCGPGFLYTDPLDIEADYEDAMRVHHVHIANNSIGTNVCSNGLDCQWTGDYGVTSQLIDSIVYGALGSPSRIIWANGNERGCGRCEVPGGHTPDGYHSTAPPACAKNPIAVGALEDDETVASFTSWGPTDDGRLKPDIVAPGRTVQSCSSDGGYTLLSGTSMAAPAVTGVAALWLQDYRDRFPLRPPPRNSTLKAVLTHTALDLEEAGPDFKTGFGSVRIRDAIDFMTGNHGLNSVEGTVTQGTAYFAWVRVNMGDAELKVTLAWDDFPAAPNVVETLVNDIDLRVYDPAGVRYFPWTLDPNVPGAPAVSTHADHTNNIEQVVVATPEAGLWRVEVFGFTVPEGPQVFSITGAPRLVFDCDGNGMPDDEQIRDDPTVDCSQNGVPDVCEPDCDGDGSVDTCEVFVGTSTDCDRNAVPDDCQFFADCDGNGRFDPCDIADGKLLDCNGNWIPDGCSGLETDCNANAVPDECDLRNKTSVDCEWNDIPDECEWRDCNGNGRYDGCDVKDETSNDCNENAIPDECEVGRTIYVDDDSVFDPAPGDPMAGDPAEDGGLSHPFDSIQEAVDSAGCSDTVILRAGVYRGLGNRDVEFHGRTVILRSESGPENCVIDCEGLGRGFFLRSGETAPTRIEGITVRNGKASEGGAILCDGAIVPTLHNCILTENEAETFGGGIACRTLCSPIISECVVSKNRSRSGGGVSSRGGGIPSIRGCRFRENVAQSSGGAMFSEYGGVLMTHTVLARNSAGAGGGFFSFGDWRGVRIINSSFVGNTAVGDVLSGPGGGILSSAGSVLTVTNCTFHRNLADAGGGMAIGAGNTTVRNCILWADRAEQGQEIAVVGFGSGCLVAHSNVAGGEHGVYLENDATVLWGPGNISADPLFLTRSEMGYLGGLTEDVRISAGSPCIDAGDNSAVPADELDVDADGDTTERMPLDLADNPRFRDDIMVADTGVIAPDYPSIIDLGAFEFPCVSIAAPTLEYVGGGIDLKNRFLSIVVDAGQADHGLAVTFLRLPPPFNDWDGAELYVGEPQAVCENASQDATPAAAGKCGQASGLPRPWFWAAPLHCDPGQAYFGNWASFGVVDLFHEGIVPGGLYKVRPVDKVCGLAGADYYNAAAVTLATSPWGDLVGSCATCPCSPADGTRPGFVTDIVALLDKYANVACAPRKARVDLQPAHPDFKIDVGDLVRALGAFSGQPYPFGPGDPEGPCEPHAR